MTEILTPCIVHNIIICSTIIILSVVAVSAFRIHKVEECQKNNSETEKKSSSCLGMYIFLSSIVVLIAVLIFSYAFYTEKKVLDFISLASALVSIILAVITIIYSFVVNSQTAGQIDKLTKTSKSLQTASTKAVESAEVMKNAAQQVLNASTSYKDTAYSLQKNIQTILDTMQHVDQTTNKLLESQEINNKFNEKDLKYGLNETMVNNFIELSSPRGNVLMYACIKACDKHAVLMLEDIMEDNSLDYCRGFLIAAKSAGLFKLRIWLDRSKGIEIIEYHPILKEILFKSCKSMETEFYTRMIKKIDSLFE